MNSEQIKQFVAERVAEGMSLSKIQDELTAQNVKITFMELRLIASEIDIAELEKLDKKSEVKKEEPAASAEESVPAEDPAAEALPESPAEEPAIPAGEPAAEDAAPRGPTVVEISKLAMPGTVMNGSVKFGSGVTADWFLDQMGRLALDKVEGGKPNEKDIEEFQIELRKMLGA